jgi:hypothetical protein
MNRYVEAAWTVPKGDDFDLRSFALGVLEIAKENLQRDGELLAAAFIVTGSQIQCVSVDFGDHEEKTVAYKQLVEAAGEANALALVTCNDAYWGNDASLEYLETYYPGKLAAEGAKECLMLTVSGPAVPTWCVDVPYEKVDKTIVFGESSESLGEEIGFLENWRDASINTH